MAAAALAAPHKTGLRETAEEQPGADPLAALER
jgi:hypothetical protein